MSTVHAISGTGTAKASTFFDVDARREGVFVKVAVVEIPVTREVVPQGVYLDMTPAEARVLAARLTEAAGS